MQANEERSSVGSLTITIYTERTSMVILEIESLVKTCFRDLLISPEDGGPYSFAWARTDPFSIEGTNVIGQDVTFDIMEYSAQETTDPDPIVALSRYIKNYTPIRLCLAWIRSESLPRHPLHRSFTVALSLWIRRLDTT